MTYMMPLVLICRMAFASVPYDCVLITPESGPEQDAAACHVTVDRMMGDLDSVPGFFPAVEEGLAEGYGICHPTDDQKYDPQKHKQELMNLYTYGGKK